MDLVNTNFNILSCSVSFTPILPEKKYNKFTTKDKMINKKENKKRKNIGEAEVEKKLFLKYV